jgi:hypothetical protein
MTNNCSDLSQRKIALTAGIAYLIMTIAAVFSILFVFEKIKAAGDALATANTILASETLFRAGFCSLLLVVVCDVVVAWALYLLFMRVNKDISLLAAVFRLVYVAIFGAAMVNLSMALNCVKGCFHSLALGSEPLQASALLFVNAFFDGWAVGLIVFGFHLLLLGYLVLKTGYIPKIIGILILIGALCYLLQNSAVLMLPNYDSNKATFDMVLGIPMALGELLLAFWLLLKGGKHSAREQV